MIAELRGGLGTQIISLAACICRGNVERIRINAKDTYDLAKVDYLSDLFIGLPPIEVSHSTAFKTRIDEPGVLLQAYTGSRRMRLKREIIHHDYSVLHKRQYVQCNTSDETYDTLKAKLPHLQVIGDLHSTVTPQEDWRFLLGAKTVFSSVSLFTITAAMFSPRMKLYLLRPDGPAQTNDKALAAIEQLTSYLPNVVWGVGINSDLI